MHPKLRAFLLTACDLSVLLGLVLLLTHLAGVEADRVPAVLAMSIGTSALYRLNQKGPTDAK